MKPLELQLDETVIHNISRVIPDPSQIVTETNTILDPDIQKHGGGVYLVKPIIDMFDRKVSWVDLPPIVTAVQGGTLLIPNLAIRFNNLLRLNEELRKALNNKSTHTNLTKSVNRYYHELACAVGGKDGVLNKNCITTRIRESGRAVALPCSNRGPEWLGVPSQMMNSLGKKEGDLCLAVRFPGIWDGSLEVFRAYKSGNNCVEVHPLMHAQYGLDHDGDCMAIYWIPNDPECQAEAEAKIIEFAKRSVIEWPSTFTRPGEHLDQPDMTDMDRVKAQTKNVLRIDGRTLSPVDIMAGLPTWLNTTTGKDLQVDNLKIALGLTKDEFMERILLINYLNVTMKVQMGPVGAMANKIKTLASDAPEIIQRSGMDLSEEVQQSLLSIKHTVGNIAEAKFSKILDILNKRGKGLTRVQPHQLLDMLEDLEVDRDMAGPFIAYAFWIYPCKQVISSLQDELDPKHRDELAVAIRDAIETSQCVTQAGANELYNYIARRTDIHHEESWRRTLWLRILDGAMGLGQIIETDYPMFSLISNSGNDQDKLKNLIERVLINRDRDSGGICRNTLTLLEGGTRYEDGNNAAQLL